MKLENGYKTRGVQLTNTTTKKFSTKQTNGDRRRLPTLCRSHGYIQICQVKRQILVYFGCD